MSFLPFKIQQCIHKYSYDVNSKFLQINVTGLYKCDVG